VFIAGVGGMGGACLMSIVRAGFEKVGIADIDTFDVSNLNRQVFSNLTSVGLDKAMSTLDQIKNLNPQADIRNWGADWLTHLDQILQTYKIVVNGTDDIRATLQLYRKAKEYGCTVIDAYTSPLPSVYVTGPQDPRPEERLRFPSRGKAIADLTAQDIDGCKLAEVIHVMSHSNSIAHIDFDLALEMVAGKRPRMSLAPMVITTGNLMAYQVVYLALSRTKKTDPVGYFLNPLKGTIERPSNFLVRKIKEFLVRRYLQKVLA
ncbi:MAG: ThiF family adenylyltransferase, partial [Bdellovibrio sp.]|nr:ThiF family adenylyltransferase [Bdellovibrio sp.]